MSKGIYLDNNATTMVDPRVVEVMLPFFSEQFGNPSSMHNFGNKVGRSIKQARKNIQTLIGAQHDSHAPEGYASLNGVGRQHRV